MWRRAQTNFDIEFKIDWSFAVIKETQTSAHAVHVENWVNDDGVEQGHRAGGANDGQQLVVVRRILELAETVIRDSYERVVTTPASRGCESERFR